VCVWGGGVGWGQSITGAASYALPLQEGLIFRFILTN
jgi:hypothetical protein